MGDDNDDDEDGDNDDDGDGAMGDGATGNEVIVVARGGGIIIVSLKIK
jgi:hypothetical protein